MRDANSHPRAHGPFASLIAARGRGRALWLSGGALGLLSIPMLAFERDMTRAGGCGIIPFELAGSEERAAQIMDRWGRAGRGAARRSLVLDYPFLASYSCLLALTCGVAADALGRRGHTWLAAAGGPIAWGQLAAGGCDAVENAALLAVLAGGRRRLPGLARAFAVNKFFLLALGFSYCLLALAVSRRAAR